MIFYHFCPSLENFIAACGKIRLWFPWKKSFRRPWYQLRNVKCQRIPI